MLFAAVSTAPRGQKNSFFHLISLTAAEEVSEYCFQGQEGTRREGA